MNKPQSLRSALNKAVAYVRDNPDKLHLFVDNGSLVATGANSMSWEYRYTLNVVIEDFSGDQNLLMAPVLLWLSDNQPDAINNPELREKLFTFEVDILRNDVCDNCPESYKPQLVEGSGRTQTVRMVLITSSTDNITLKIDPAVVLATRKYVDDKALELKVYVDDLMAKHLAAPDPHSQYAQKDSPTLTGIPKVPTPAAGNSTKQIANTEFVASSIAAMVDSAPAALDTLNELAAALGNDPNFATTMINALAGKQPLDNTLTNLSGKDIAGLLT
ncbi:hypothetical protein JE384_004085, partial [Salmonella enterica]|nr:hypothetical protein [Salmonella enterica]